EFIGLLIDHRERFLIVGAHAVAANGRPRATQALDVWVEPTRANAERLCEALRKFGFDALGDAVEEFSSPERMASLGNYPMRVDVMTSIDVGRPHARAGSDDDAHACGASRGNA